MGACGASSGTDLGPAVLDLVDGKRDGLLRSKVRSLLVAAPTPAEAGRLSARSLRIATELPGRYFGAGDGRAGPPTDLALIDRDPAGRHPGDPEDEPVPSTIG